MDKKTLVSRILEVSGTIDNGRHPYSVLASLTEEVGELGKEVAISQGDSYKKADVDGIIGESIDVILAAVDMIYLADKTITEEQILAYAETKLAKWVSKTSEYGHFNKK